MNRGLEPTSPLIVTKKQIHVVSFLRSLKFHLCCFNLNILLLLADYEHFVVLCSVVVEQRCSFLDGSDTLRFDHAED